jgi:hypothetical protein
LLFFYLLVCLFFAFLLTCCWRWRATTHPFDEFLYCVMIYFPKLMKLLLRALTNLSKATIVLVEVYEAIIYTHFYGTATSKIHATSYCLVTELNTHQSCTHNIAKTTRKHTVTARHTHSPSLYSAIRTKTTQQHTLQFTAEYK